MRTEKQILRKVNAWKNNPMLVSGVYRLFTYIPFDSIPEQYQEFFNEEAREAWSKGEDILTNKDISNDIKAQIQALLKVLNSKNITQALGFVPVMMADVYAYGKGTAKIQADLLKALKNYKEYVSIDRPLSEQYAVTSIIEILRYTIRELKLDMHFDFESAVEKILASYDVSNTAKITPELNAQVDKLLEDYKKAKGEDDGE